MIICNHLRDGSISGINVEYICRICNVAIAVRFEGRMSCEEIEDKKNLVNSILCHKHCGEVSNGEA